ncbi:MAG: histidinol-phosphate transaminase [Gammaproteobacteria bacterium]|nr:histidinol-phosphate transaminase [Gammaproteobacteria bacterium]
MKKMNKKIFDYLRKDIKNIGNYEIVGAEGLAKLDAMENPYEFLANISFEKFSDKNLVSLNRYPDSYCNNTKDIIKKSLNLNCNIDLAFGNGSDELIQMICLAFLKEGNKVLAPEPSFSMYERITKIVGLEFISVPLAKDFNLNIEDIKKVIKRSDPAIVFLAYPNNPTGNVWDEESVIEIIKSSNSLVVIDEAYFPFSKKTLVNLIDEYENIIILRTFSKIGLAGIRFGYAIGNEELISIINKMRLPFNINSMSQNVINVVLKNLEKFNFRVEEIIQARKELFSKMLSIKGIETYESYANFILFRILDKDAGEVFNSLCELGVLVKDVSGEPGLKNCLRVTVGNESENSIFLSSLESILLR